MYVQDILQNWWLQRLVPMYFGGWFLLYMDINIFFYVWPQLDFEDWYRDKYLVYWNINSYMSQLWLSMVSLVWCVVEIFSQPTNYMSKIVYLS